MYDTKRLASGVGILLVLWAMVGLLVLSSGVGVSVPLTASGGFNISADYMGASEATAVPDKVEDRLVPVVRFEVKKSFLRDMWLNKTLNVSSVPGLTGTIQLAMRSERATIHGAAFQTNSITADTAIWRGFVLDERKADDIFGEFYSYAGPNPNQAPNTDDPLDIAGSGEGDVRDEMGSRPAFQLYDMQIRASTLTADQAQLSNFVIVIQYDSNNDGVYEYGT